MTRRDLLSLLAGAAVFPVAAVSCGRGPAGSSVSQVKSPLPYSSLADVAKLIAARELLSMDLTKTFPSRASEYGPGVRAALEYGQRVTRAALAVAEGSIRSLRVTRAHAEHRRLSGVSVDGEHCTLKNRSVPIRTGVKKALDVHLTHQPTKVSKSRINRLRGLSQPQCRLRVGDIRVFYHRRNKIVTLEIKMLDSGDNAILDNVAPDVFDNSTDPVLVAQFLTDPRHHLAVAIDGGQVVGFASGVHYVHPDKPSEMWINEAGVAPRHQGRSIGKAILRTLLRHAEHLGCREAWVLTDRSNSAAMRLLSDRARSPMSHVRDAEGDARCDSPSDSSRAGIRADLAGG